jgi:DNA-binding SARP family transcriptional activator
LFALSGRAGIGGTPPAPTRDAAFDFRQYRSGVEAIVVAAVETPVGSEAWPQAQGWPGVRMRLLGPMAIERDGATLRLPASRKVRALIGYLTMAPQGVSRTHLCELLWDVPNDPRGELRWCLSKIRRLLDEPGRRRVETPGDVVRLDLDGCSVDAVEIAAALQAGIQSLPVARLDALSSLFAGDFLDGVDIDRSPLFDGWLIAQRRRFRAGHTAILEHLAERLPRDGEAILGCLEKWLTLAPFDRRAHEAMLDALARRNRLREGEEHLEAAARAFESEGYDSSPLREAWRAAKQRQRAPAVARVGAAASSSPAPPSSGDAAPQTASRRASIAVMPFHDRAAGAVRGGLGDGLAHDVITRLAKLRSLTVIAQGTVFALCERGLGPEEAGRALGVDYVASGSLVRRGGRVGIAVELTETRTARIVWAEAFDEPLDDALLVLDEIGDRIVASIAGEIEAAERNRAILKPPSSLDAWEAYHRGLWHMYRFSRPHNEQAQRFFDMAVRLDSTFARAYAGLSFTHFQNAFQGWADRAREMDLAIESAGQSVMIDERDPTGHWAMGRALWLRGQSEQSLVELDMAVDLSPNFALGHYMLSFVRSQSGDPAAAIAASDRSRHLSPFDPLLFGMLGTRALAHVRMGQFEEAAEWAVKAAARPNAHVHIQSIAAHCLAMAGRLNEARALVAAIRRAVPGYRNEDFLSAFHFAPDAEALFRRSGKKIDFA